MKRINVLFMQSQTYFGADSHIHSLLMRYLDRDQFEVHVACNTGSRGENSPAAIALAEIPDIHFRPTSFGPSVNHRSPIKIAADLVSEGVPGIVDLGRLARYMKKHDINIVHCTEKPRDAFYGLILARLTGAKCLVHLHVKAEDWISSLVLWAMHRADALVGVSAFVADSIVQMGYAADKTSYVWNALDARSWPADVNGRSIRQEFNIPPDLPLLLIASRLYYWKGHRELLQALAIVKQNGGLFKLLIVGEDDPRAHPGGGSFKTDLELLVEKLQLQDEVVFTGYRQDMPKLMAACDIFTMPSFEEPFGMVYLEAMAMQKPVIALDNGGAKEIVEHEKSGLLSLPQDDEQLAANIQKLLQDASLRHCMGERGRQRLLELFTPGQMAEGFENVYSRLMQE